MKLYLYRKNTDGFDRTFISRRKLYLNKGKGLRQIQHPYSTWELVPTNKLKGLVRIPKLNSIRIHELSRDTINHIFKVIQDTRIRL